MICDLRFLIYDLIFKKEYSDYKFHPPQADFNRKSEIIFNGKSETKRMSF